MRGRHWVWLGLLILGGAGLLGYRAATHSLGITTGTSQNEVFYRFTASYTVDKTETVSMDVVVGCRIAVTGWKFGGSTVRVGRSPTHFPIRTKGSHVILVQIPNACSEFSYGKTVSDKVFPLVQWIESANDLRFGTAYATEDAYLNGSSRLGFNGAAFSRATADDWEVWRQSAEKDFAPTDAIREPWGFDSRELNQPDRGRGHYIARTCNAMARFRVPEQYREILRQYWPQERPIYWLASSTAGIQKTIYESLLRKPIFDGFEYWDYVIFGGGNDYARGIRRRSGSGRIGAVAQEIQRNFALPELYPESRNGTAHRGEDALRLDDTTTYRLQFDPSVKGFAYCYLSAASLGPNLFARDGKWKAMDVAVNDVPVFISDHFDAFGIRVNSSRMIIVERDEYLFVGLDIPF